MTKNERRRSEKGEETRNRIIDASVDLFLEKGYEKTTIRDIGLKAGVLPGSMYNLFKNKDEVFAEVISEALWDSVRESKKYISNDESLASRLSFPIFLQVYAASKSTHIAGLLSTIYRKWDMKKKCLESLLDWIEETEEGHDITSMPDFFARMHASLGALSSVIECFENQPDEMSLRSSMMIVGKVFHDLFYSVDDLDSRIDRMISIFENNEIRICGITV